MTFRPKYSNIEFNKISVDNFIRKYKLNNPNADIVQLKSALIHFKELRSEGIKCNCGNSLWVIGSALSGKTCFTCLTGESDFSNEFDIE